MFVQLKLLFVLMQIYGFVSTQRTLTIGKWIFFCVNFTSGLIEFQVNRTMKQKIEYGQRSSAQNRRLQSNTDRTHVRYVAHNRSLSLYTY